MDLPGRNKDERTRFYRVPASPIKEQPAPSRHEIKFIAIMGLLRIISLRRVQLNVDRSVGKDRDGEVSSRWRTFR